ncbi:hypothetical protein SDC9_16262 [bioreactor metagenome]|uniref:Uncharacterized protein n=1 Tax=bioreactor metagenome TaxID=1076179 RepID=A0A644TUD0_9ZZZZ
MQQRDGFEGVGREGGEGANEAYRGENPPGRVKEGGVRENEHQAHQKRADDVDKKGSPGQLGRQKTIDRPGKRKTRQGAQASARENKKCRRHGAILPRTGPQRIY